jgi:WD40 repeat protein
VLSVALSRDGRYALTGGRDWTVRLWDLTSDPPGREVRSLEGHREAVLSVALSGDGTRAASCGSDRSIRVWNLATGEELFRRFWQEGPVWSVAFSPDGKRLLSGGNSRESQAVVVWDVESRQEIERVKTEISDHTSVAISPDGRWRAAGGSDRATAFWRSEAGADVRHLEPGAGSSQQRLAFSGGSRFLFVGSSDGTVRRIDVENPDLRQQLQSYAGGSKPLTGVACSADDSLLAASAEDGRVFLWDAATTAMIREWRLPGKVNGVAFDAKGRHLALACGNGAVFFLRVPRGE